MGHKARTQPTSLSSRTINRTAYRFASPKKLEPRSRTHAENYYWVKQEHAGTPPNDLSWWTTKFCAGLSNGTTAIASNQRGQESEPADSQARLKDYRISSIAVLFV